MSKNLIWEKNGDIFEADGFQMYPVSLFFEILPSEDSFHLQLCSDKDCIGYDDYSTLEEAQRSAQWIIDHIAEQVSQKDIDVPLSEKTKFTTEQIIEKFATKRSERNKK